MATNLLNHDNFGRLPSETRKKVERVLDETRPEFVASIRAHLGNLCVEAIGTGAYNQKTENFGLRQEQFDRAVDLVGQFKGEYSAYVARLLEAIASERPHIFDQATKLLSIARPKRLKQYAKMFVGRDVIPYMPRSA